MKKIVNKIKAFFNDHFKGLEHNLEQHITSEIERLIKEEVYANLPHCACWLCSNPIRRGGGYLSWRGRVFCCQQCLDKFSQLISKPNEDYQYLYGDPIEVINGESLYDFKKRKSYEKVEDKTGEQAPKEDK
jgi:hypothetical protein